MARLPIQTFDQTPREDFTNRPRTDLRPSPLAKATANPYGYIYCTNTRAILETEAIEGIGGLTEGSKALLLSRHSDTVG